MKVCLHEGHAIQVKATQFLLSLIKRTKNCNPTDSNPQTPTEHHLIKKQKAKHSTLV